MQVHKIKTPAAVLQAAVLAHKPVKPELKSACQIEIGAAGKTADDLQSGRRVITRDFHQAEQQHRTENSGGVATAGGDLGEPGHPTGDQGGAGDEDRFRAKSGNQ